MNSLKLILCLNKLRVIEGFYSDELMKTIAKKGSLKEIKEVPRTIQNVFVTAHDVSTGVTCKNASNVSEIYRQCSIKNC